MGKKVGSYTLLIREHHLDTFGHMNNATYLEILEEARWELITSRGFGLKEIQKKKQGPIILDVYLKFTKELKLRDEVEITTELLDHEGKIGKLRQNILRGDEVCATADFTIGFFDLAQRKIIEPTDEWKYAIGLTD